MAVGRVLASVKAPCVTGCWDEELGGSGCEVRGTWAKSGGVGLSMREGWHLGLT